MIYPGTPEDDDAESGTVAATDPDESAEINSPSTQPPDDDDDDQIGGKKGGGATDDDEDIGHKTSSPEPGFFDYPIPKYGGIILIGLVIVLLGMKIMEWKRNAFKR